MAKSSTTATGPISAFERLMGATKASLELSTAERRILSGIQSTFPMILGQVRLRDGALQPIDPEMISQASHFAFVAAVEIETRFQQMRDEMAKAVRSKAQSKTASDKAPKAIPLEEE